MGSDREVSSDFQLICGTNRDLRADAMKGRFRDDLLARINLWTFALPALAERRAQELQHMHRNFYGFDPSYHVARHHFVTRKPHAWTPRHLATHRR